MTRDYQMCTRCVMDTTDPEISFDENGICNHCTSFLKKKDRILLPEAERKSRLDKFVSECKKWGEGKDYDCIAGISGGVDSTYMV